MSTAPRASVRAAAAAALILAKAAIALTVLAFGFTHVSDDDYARVVIAQAFAAAPRIDPSGTSWLPLPFWVTGGAMIITGRSLLAARIVAVLLGAVSPLPAFFALRRGGVGMNAIHVGLVLAFASPWCAWSAAATIPDGWTAALVAAAAFGLMARDDEMRGLRLAAGCAAAAALARYEAWPLCAVVAARATVLLGRRRDLARQLAPTLILAVVAPIAWMAWNLHAHGDPLHFLARVATFRRQLGAASVPLATKLAEYPRALWDEAPEALLPGLPWGPLVWSHRRRTVRARLRSRWCWPTARRGGGHHAVPRRRGTCATARPTHHPVRPLLGVVVILVVCGRRRAGGPAPAAADRRAHAAARRGGAGRDPRRRRPRARPAQPTASRRAPARRTARYSSSEVSVLRATTGPSGRAPRDAVRVRAVRACWPSFAAPERVVVEAARPPSPDGECPRVTVDAR